MTGRYAEYKELKFKVDQIKLGLSKEIWLALEDLSARHKRIGQEHRDYANSLPTVTERNYAWWYISNI